MILLTILKLHVIFAMYARARFLSTEKLEMVKEELISCLSLESSKGPILSTLVQFI